MKARVKATGEIVTITGTDGICLTDENGNYHLIRDLEGCEAMPDYWEKLTHQAAIGAMQVMLASGVPTSLQYQYTKEADHHNVIADEAVKFAVSLVTKIKNHDEENKVQGNPQ